MNNFIYHNPTKLVFGKGQIARLPKLIPAGKRIMLTFGGGSVKRNGVYDQVVAALEGRDLVEFWGIEANPSVETLREAIALGKERKVDFLLAARRLGRSSTVRNSSLRACSTTAIRGISCSRGRRIKPFRWAPSSRCRPRVRR